MPEQGHSRGKEAGPGAAAGLEKIVRNSLFIIPGISNLTIQIIRTFDKKQSQYIASSYPYLCFFIVNPRRNSK